MGDSAAVKHTRSDIADEWKRQRDAAVGANRRAIEYLDGIVAPTPSERQCAVDILRSDITAIAACEDGV